MTATTIRSHTSQRRRTPVFEQLEDLSHVQQQMLQAAMASQTRQELLKSLGELLGRHASSEAMYYFHRDDQGGVIDTICLQPTQDDGRSERSAEQLTAYCQTACQSGNIQLHQQASPPRVIVAAPIAQRTGTPDALGIIFPADDEPRILMMLVQMVASHIVLWDVSAAERVSSQIARHSAGIVEILEHLAAAPDLRSGCYSLAGELQTHLRCDRVAVGLRTSGRGRCHLIAVSGVAQFDKSSTSTRAIEAAMDEAVFREALSEWPALDGDQRHGVLALRELCSVERATNAIVIPLSDDTGISVGALLVLNDTNRSLASANQFLQAAEKPIAASLSAAQKQEGGRVHKLVRATGRAWSTIKGKAALVAICLLLSAMLIPQRYRIDCNCRIEPVTRRYVAAPFDGRLVKALVQPGDTVQDGDVIADLDGREVRWERARVVAEREQAIKKRDVAQATHNYAEQQIAQLDIERLSLELSELDYRSENLSIRSPLSGVVASGDLERADGAPLKIGQTLFEIAPLEKMVVEVAVPDDEVSFVRGGQSVEVRLDAYPDQVWQAVVTNVQPRSEIRDEENVFIAEAELDNSGGRLRPGMKGRTKVVTDNKAVGWIYFHKPWEYMMKRLAW